MANIQAIQKPPPVVISKFLGLNLDPDGQTELKLGEASEMQNWRVTDSYKLKKMEGYAPLFTTLGAHPIRGQWYGKVAGTFYHLFACNGKVYKCVNGVNTELGTLTDAPTRFFYFGTKVYMINANEFKSWDGTNFIDVVGYRPCIAINAPPTGGGTLFEEANVLTGAKYMTFSANGSATAYTLAETSLTTVDYVKVNGVLKTVTTDYTVNLTTGIITFLVAPTTGVGNVEIGWTKGSGSRSVVTANKYFMFYGGENDTRVFLWGNTSAKNRLVYTGLAAGVPSAEYFPANSFTDIGNAEYAITDIVRQQNNQIIFTEGDAWWSVYSPITDATDNTIASFPVYPLNSAKGNVAAGQVQLINNNPVTIFEGLYNWQATNVRDERNAVYFSKRIQPDLDNVDLTTAITFDWEEMGELWLCVGSVCWIYNYRNDTFYKRTNVAATCFLVIDKELYFGSTDGIIYKFNSANEQEEIYKDDNGTAIQARWEMNFYDFEAEWLRKYINRLWISLKPDIRVGVDITYQTDRNSNSPTYTATYNLSTFEHANFNHFSFKTNYNPQPFRFKIKAKKFSYFKLILENNSREEVATVLSIDLSNRYGGEVK